MAKSKSSYNNQSIQKMKKKEEHVPSLSELEMEAARQLIQLSSGDSCDQWEEDNLSSSINNNSFSFQGTLKQQQSKFDAPDVSSGVGLEEAEDESFGRRRRKKRYRYVCDLYSLTEPMRSCC